jgi:hypothetical protein
MEEPSIQTRLDRLIRTREILVERGIRHDGNSGVRSTTEPVCINGAFYFVLKEAGVLVEDDYLQREEMGKYYFNMNLSRLFLWNDQSTDEEILAKIDEVIADLKAIMVHP